MKISKISKAFQSWKLLFILSFLIAGNSFGQTVTIKEGKFGKPIQEVYVYSQKNERGVISDSKGKVDLSQFGENELLSFKHVKFEDFRIKKSEIKNGIVKLKEKENSLPTVYYDYPLRYNIDSEDEAGQIEQISRDIVKIENPATSADMLQNTGNVLVQKSQGGGGSPIIRGFEANKLLLVIDGVRMNNAIYRSGHLQNAITIDNSILDHTEIIYGPSSSLYGSDALGGVIHFHTRDPLINNKDSMYFDGSSYFRLNSNNRSMTGHFDFSTGKKKWALLSSITANQFGDIIMGENRYFNADPNFALHNEIAVQSNGLDTIVQNQDPLIQANSGYNQFDILQKFVYRSNSHLKYTLNFQYSTSSKVNRYDKLTEYKDGSLRFSEWYYGPQNRLFGQFKVDFSKNPNNPNNKWYHNGVFSAAYQRIDEDRISRFFNSAIREHQEEDVHVFSLNLDFNKILKRNRIIFYGLEVQHNLVHSTAFEENISSGFSIDAQTRYPNISNYLSSGLYVEHKQKFKNKATLTAGLRLSAIFANSNFNDNTFLQLPFEEVNLFAMAPSGNLGFVMRPNTLTNIKVLASSGFRAPNIDDYGKVFEKKGVTVVPNDQLTPEFAIGGETSIQRKLLNEKINFGAVVYGTYLFNAMVQRDFTLNGQDSIFYAGENTKIQAIVNTDNAIVYGTSINMKINFSKLFSLNYSYNYTKGTDLTANTPLEHIPPQFGRINFTYSAKKLNTSLYSFYNFRKNLSDYTAGGDNIDLTPNAEGTPPWWTLNYRFSYTFYDNLTVQAAIENILDVHYLQFSSGIASAGRNVMFSIKADF
ncbi:MAG: TonB-dependent receptor [Crocinitomicaceae bacterium]|nr:TonB-dependent receptor [Crocinitomicaceae bacterium]